MGPIHSDFALLGAAFFWATHRLVHGTTCAEPLIGWCFAAYLQHGVLGQKSAMAQNGGTNGPRKPGCFFGGFNQFNHAFFGV